MPQIEIGSLGLHNGNGEPKPTALLYNWIKILKVPNEKRGQAGEPDFHLVLRYDERAKHHSARKLATQRDIEYGKKTRFQLTSSAWSPHLLYLSEE